jgi:hypothetical protein
MTSPLCSSVSRVVSFAAGNGSAKPDKIPIYLSKPLKPLSLSSDVKVRIVQKFSSQRKHETKLLVAMLRDPMFYKTEGKEAVFDKHGKANMDVLFSVASRGDFDKLVRCDVLTWQWNINFALDLGGPVSWHEHELSIAESETVFAKEEFHVKSELVRLSRAGEHKLLPDSVKALVTTVSTAEMPQPAYAPLLDSGADTVPSFSGSVAPVMLPRVEPALVNQVVGLQAQPVADVPQQQRQRGAATSAPSQAKKSKLESGCPKCERGRHDTPEQKQCAFFRWTVRFPPKNLPGRREESLSDTKLAKKVWLERNLDRIFCDGAWGETWTWEGPQQE